MRRAALAALLAAACGAHEPAASVGPARRPAGAAAPAPPSPAAELRVVDEKDALAAALRRLPPWAAQAGVELVLDDEALLPYVDPDTGRIHVHPFLGGVDAMRGHLAQLSAAAFAGRLRFEQQFDNPFAAYQAYRVFFLLALAHEATHVLRAARGRVAPSRYDEETAAIDVELAYLRLLEADGVAPGWRARYRDFNRAILAALPEEVVAAIPEDPVVRRAVFDRNDPLVLPAIAEAARTGVNPSQGAVDVVLAIYTLYRLELVEADALPPPAEVIAGALGE